jgi:hypothetical protein
LYNTYYFTLTIVSSSHDPVIRMFLCLFIVLKIPLFSMSSSHDSVIRMFRCLFIVLKISLFSMSSSHDPVIRMFHCLFIVLKIPLLSMPSNHAIYYFCRFAESISNLRGLHAGKGRRLFE